MGIIVPVKDGQVVDTSASSNSLSEAGKSSGSSLGKDAFLQLLVAQMKYQDPLEPTSNTEYISQLATFSSLEEMQNLNTTMEAQQATNLVGKTVIMKVTSKTGASDVVQGKVDYIVKENGKLYVSIEDNLYSLDDLDKVVDDDYLDALSIAEDFEKVLDELPDPKKLTLEDKDALEAVRKAYNSLTAYQQKFIEKYCEPSLNKLKELLAKMKELEQIAGEGDDSNDDTDTDGTEGAEGSDDKDDTSKV